MKYLFVILCLAFSIETSFSQVAEESAVFYFIGNFADTEKNRDKYIHALELLAEGEERMSYFIFTGDIVDQNGLSGKKDKKYLEGLKTLANHDRVKLLFTPGDRDWDESGSKGEKKVKDLEEYLEKDLKIKKSMFPSGPCPGPEYFDVEEHTRLIFINSQWFIHPKEKAGVTDSDCEILSQQTHPIRLTTYWDEIEDMIRDAGNRTVFLVAHHPVFSNGKTGGKHWNQSKIFPVAGWLYSSYRKNIGTPKEMVYPSYTEYAGNIREILEENSQVLFVSGHDHSTDLQEISGNYHLNSGALSSLSPLDNSENTLFLGKSKGISQVETWKDGRVAFRFFEFDQNSFYGKLQIPLFRSACHSWSEFESAPANERRNPCKIIEKEKYNWNEIEKGSTARIVADTSFKAGTFKKWLMGNHYRKQWTDSMDIPVLNLKKDFGGLRPIRTGGSGQTPSLRFLGGDGYEYYFRSIRKNPEMGMDEFQINSIYSYVTKDMTSNAHPYLGIAISDLLDHTDILHEKVDIYVIPDDPALGQYRSKFGNLPGYMQRRVTKNKETGKGFGDFEILHSTTKLYRNLFKDSKNKLDQFAYAKARMFDMWVGDWDRHEDNWKWAGIKKKGAIDYKPIPKDRDHVFSKYEGILPKLVNAFIPNQEGFGSEIGNVQAMNFNARFIDRLFANQLDINQWQKAAAYFKDVMTDTAIENSFNRVPGYHEDPDIQSIIENLKRRRDILEDAAKSYYKILAREVDVLGSNNRDIFEIVFLKDGKISVSGYDRKKNGNKGILFYQREFDPAFTKEVRIYTLGARDEIYLKGVDKGELIIRIIGGKGKDKILTTDNASDKIGRSTYVYDKKNEDEIQLSGNPKIVKPYVQVEYNPQAFVYDTYFPFVGVRSSSGNKFGIDFLYKHTKQGFNKPGFDRILGLKYIYYPGLNAHRIRGKITKRHVFKGWDGQLEGTFAKLYDKYPFFYGLGSNSERDEELGEEDFYRLDYNTGKWRASLQKKIWFKSEVRAGILYEYNSIKPYLEDFSIFNKIEFQNLEGMGKEHIAGAFFSIDINFVDKLILPQSGTKVVIGFNLWNRLSQDHVWASRTSLMISHYESFHIGLPFTLSFQGGGEWSTGSPAFYQMARLGSNAYMKGTVRNRYLGDKLVFLNGELRTQIGTWMSPLLPLHYGMFGFASNGKIWVDNDSDPNWIHTVGGGFYLAPAIAELIFELSLAKSADKGFYYSLGLTMDL